MASMQRLTAGAAGRASSRAAGYRASGHWRTDPVDLVRDAAARHPERIALVERGRSLRYADLDAAVDGAVAALRSERVGRGDAVLLLAGNDVTRFHHIEGRFSSPVLPGEALTVKAWRTGDGEAVFTTSVGDRVVIKGRGFEGG